MTDSISGIPRHWWGKIIGAFLGLLRGGLSGALIGALIGHLFDRLVLGLTGGRSTRDRFFHALFSALGHINKADGRVTQAEIAAAESLMQRLQLTPGERQDAIRCFNAGKSREFDLAAALRPFAQHTALRPDLRQMFVEILLDGASADGTITAAEQAALARVCAVLHIPDVLFAAMLNARRAGPGAGQRRSHAGRQRPPLSRAYATLGITEKASDADVKKAYRRLVRQYHPDRLVSQGLPEPMMEKAKERVREINGAYEQIKQARGFK